MQGAERTKAYQADDRRWAEAMRCVQAGDERQYQQLLSELSSVIHRYLTSRLGHNDFIEDCVQDILLAIHDARHTYRPEQPFRPWLFAIVRNKSIDALRRRKSYEKVREQATLEAAALHETASHNSPHNRAHNSADNDIIKGQLIEALAPPFQQAIVLTKLAGFTTAEAARELSISETALKVRVHRGITKLKGLFEADEL